MRIIISATLGHFQRPGNPGEPSTYPVIPPTAVEGLVNAVYWHPGQSVQVKSIAVLNPIQYTTETVTQLDHQTGKPWLRTYELLVEPKYLVDFWLECDDNVETDKRIGQLTRRLTQGKHYYQPCMGLSDYPATVELLDKDNAGPPVHPSVQTAKLGLGRMPHYWTWQAAPKPIKKSFARRTTTLTAERPLQRVSGEPVMFEAQLVNGILTIPKYPKRGENGYAD